MPAFTMRLPDSDHEALQAMSLLTNKSMAELVREAIVEKVARFVMDEEVEQQIEADANKRKAALQVLRSNAV